MNKWIGIGRLTRDPDVRYTDGADGNHLCIARYTLATDRRGRAEEGQQNADFIPCVALGKNGEFAEKYFKKGIKIAVEGRIQTGSYTNKDGVKVYTTDVMIEHQEFAESKGTSDRSAADAAVLAGAGYIPSDQDGFMQIPEGIEEELPFN